MKNRRGLLQLEGLTERIVPAVSIRALDGDLVISGIANTATGFQRLWINVTAANEVEIQDGGTAVGTGGIDRGTFSVTGDLILNLSNRKDSVVISLDGGDLDGSIVANLFNGNDEFTLNTDGAARTIFGGLTVDGGNGTDTLTVFNGDAGDFEIQGGISFNGGAAQDIVDINDTGAAGSLLIGSGLTLTRANKANIGTVDNVSISGNAVINASADKLVTNVFNIGATGDVTIAGALALTGGQGSDTVDMENVRIVDVVPAEDEVMEISINLDRGTNTTTFTDIEFGMAGTDADFVYTGGTGNDSITFDTDDLPNTISGDAVFVLGNGTNSITVNDTGAKTNTFDADVTITGGKAIDAIVFNTAIVSGLLSATLGNGTNSLTSGGEIAGGLTYTGGSNGDTVTLTNGEDLAGDVSISTGAGIDEVEISGTTNVAVTSLTVDLGIDSASDILDYDAVFDALITILNQGSGDTVTSVP